MRILFIGGTGNISLDCASEALRQGAELFLLTRGRGGAAGELGRPLPEGAAALLADIHDEAAAARALEGLDFDCVVDFIAYQPEDAERDIRLFEGRTRQFVFISSASAYRKPALNHLISESTALANPWWDYSRAKIACEGIFRAAWRDRGFPLTIVRPSHTYSTGTLPLAFGSRDFTLARRMLDGKPVIVHGDGQSLWTLTHAEDFARGLLGLAGNPLALGEDFTVTSDEAFSWETIHLMTAAALGVEPVIVHMPTDFIAEHDGHFGSTIKGDKAWSSLFDCSKLKRLVPGFRTEIPFALGLRRSVDWLLADPARQRVDLARDQAIERLLGLWERAMAAAREYAGAGGGGHA